MASKQYPFPEKLGTYEDYQPEKVTARELDVTPRTMRRWRRLQIGPPHLKMGPRRIVYRVADVREWLDSQRENGGKK